MQVLSPFLFSLLFASVFASQYKAHKAKSSTSRGSGAFSDESGPPYIKSKNIPINSLKPYLDTERQLGTIFYFFAVNLTFIYYYICISNARLKVYITKDKSQEYQQYIDGKLPELFAKGLDFNNNKPNSPSSSSAPAVIIGNVQSHKHPPLDRSPYEKVINVDLLNKAFMKI